MFRFTIFGQGVTLTLQKPKDNKLIIKYSKLKTHYLIIDSINDLLFDIIIKLLLTFN